MKSCLLFCFLFTLVSTAFPDPTEKKIRILLQDSVSGSTSQAFIYFGQGFSPTYITPEDQEMYFDSVMQVPDVYSFSSNGVPCYSNSYGDYTSTTTLRLGIRVQGGSTYSFTLGTLLNFDPASLVLLEDQSSGVFTNLREHPYSVAINTSGRIDNRFYLHISYPPQLLISNTADCSNSNGVVSIAEDNSVTWSSCSLYNSQYTEVGHYTNISGNFNFTSLPEDSYTIEFNYGTYAITKNIFLPGNQVTVNLTASKINAGAEEDIDFFANAANATDYEWQMGDSTIITGIANPSYDYLEPGIYEVTLKASNPHGCFATGSLNMDISNATTSINSLNSSGIKVFSNNMDITVQIDNASADSYVFQLYNLSGQMLNSGPITSGNFVIHQNNISSGIYVLKLVDRIENNALSKKLFLTQ